jgi:hypothetical protein
MARLDWDAFGSRFYEAGVDRGVLYVDGYSGVPWNGLTSIDESPLGGDAQSYYVDGVKYLAVISPDEFEGTLTAFTYPDEFMQCDGTVQPRGGLFLTHQRRKSFGLSYRTMVGSDQTDSAGYKLHIVYNALASPSTRSNTTLKDTTDPNDFSWKITCRPSPTPGYKPTAHIVIDSRDTDPSVLALLEDTLYGTDEEASRLPDFTEVIDIFDSVPALVVVDNGDGTWTATAPFDIIRMLDDETFEITAPTAVFIDADTYTLSSA